MPRLENQGTLRELDSLHVITFDATGTLFSCPRLGEIYSEVLERHGVEAPTERILELFPLVLKELACRLEARSDRFASHPKGARGFWHDLVSRLGAYLGATPSRFATAELFERFSHAEAWSVYEEVPGVLRSLVERGHRLAVVSNWDERLPGLLGELELDQYFEHVLTSSALGVAKPHPAVFERALALLEVRPERALHVGDGAMEDGEGAAAAGMRSLVIDRSRGETLELVIPAR